ncbi:MAG: hypothetical protein IH855_00095 [Bacteroidetes bacterium]|nr:hypothetical protein [Bacteroidota bacterium]
MARLKNPATFSAHYGVSPKEMVKLGVLNPTLAIDTKLFIDPLLLAHSKHSEMNSVAVAQYTNHFQTIISLLQASSMKGDVAWRGAIKLFQFHEVSGTCLGYGSSIKGSAFGEKLTADVMRTAKEIVDLGVRDPNLFVALALFEEGVGPDRISDMTTNVIIDALAQFNTRVLTSLGVPTKRFNILGRSIRLAENPFESKPTPVILVPTDVLKELPLATDWDDVADAASHNSILRDRVNQHIGHLWATRAKRNKRLLRDQAMSSAAGFKTLLDVLQGAKNQPYDPISDPSGLRRWAEEAKAIAEANPLSLTAPTDLDLGGVYDLVRQIVDQFRQLVENNGLAKSLWRDSKHLPEQYAQRLFFAVAYAYCQANNLDISPEADSGRGPVDFKVSRGGDSKVLVEVKLSTNTKLVSGYSKQLEAYKAAEQSSRAIYLVLDVGRMGRKDQELYKLRNEASAAGDPLSDIEIVNAIPKPSASKL